VCRPQLARELLSAAPPEDVVLAMASTAVHFSTLREPVGPETWANLQAKAKAEQLASEEAARAAALADASPGASGQDDAWVGEGKCETSSGNIGAELVCHPVK
jgi:hypothetical protein